MSEKKEYIGIFKTSDVKINGKDYIAKIPAGGSELYTRAEAVDRINHALCVKIHGPCNQCTQVPGHCNDYKSYAEAALSALLGGDNA